MKIVYQIGLIFVVCLAGEVIASMLPFVFPASILSMLFLFLLLLCGMMKLHHIQDVGDFLLKNMAFFFIPAGVAIIQDFGLLHRSLFPFLMVCLITTIITFAVTGYTVWGVILLQQKFRVKFSPSSAAETEVELIMTKEEGRDE